MSVEEFSMTQCHCAMIYVKGNSMYTVIKKINFTRRLLHWTYLRNSNEKLPSFWMSYLDIVEILLNLLRVSTEGNFELNLTVIKEIIPWCFAHNILNYARYLSVYVSEIHHLKEEQPEALKCLNLEDFLHIVEDNPLKKAPVGQQCEHCK